MTSLFPRINVLRALPVITVHKAKLLAPVALLSLCLFSMVILLGACGGSSDDPKTVVDHYYAAMQKHDYNTAIQYLQVTGAPNPSMNVTTAGELQTMDSHYNGIKSYKINSQSINNQTASVNVTVDNYPMNVELSQVNGAWIITGGDVPNYLY
ncbi:MAG: DUF4878 domain-containing protein [Chloroflexota bacterium]|nr:DUF4878 domain-containing protein [Chloroflexota bacterium]